MKRKIITIITCTIMILSMVTIQVGAMSKSEWKDFYGTVEEKDDGVSMFANAAYTEPLDPSYIGIDFSIQRLSDIVDTWISMGFLETSEEALEPLNANPKGIFLMFRNAGGKLSVSMYNTGMSQTYFENQVMDIDIFNNELTLEWLQDEENDAWDLYINKSKVNRNGITLNDVDLADFTNDEGKTFVSFAAYDASGSDDHHEMRSWTINSIVNETDDPPTEATPPETEEPDEEDPDLEEPEPSEKDEDPDDGSQLAPGQTTEPDASDEDDEGPNKTLLGIVIGVIVIVGILVAILVIKKKNKV